MSQPKDNDKSILLQMQEQGVRAPRVKLEGTERSDDATERYEIVGEIARGGVGIVERGRDTDVGRDVAIKVLHDRHLRSPELVQRFVEEAQIGGQLQHPGIVPVYELGLRADKRPFFAMKLVKGETLAARLGERQSPTDGRRALLAVFRDVCRTMSYAHSRGVVHRDLKPSNVMIGNFGEVQVVDWGFAKVLRKGGVADEKMAGKRDRDRTMVSTVRSDGDDQSVAGSVMGTPAYMPPEQALGRVDDLDERSDVFSLGAILCEILTGDAPYTGSSSERMTAATHARLEPALGRIDACGADESLIALCERCLEPLPADRPSSAEDVADEVADYLTSAEGRAHQARVRAVEAEAEAVEQHRRRRQTILVGGAVLAALVIAVGTYFVLDAASTQRASERQAAVETARQDMTRLFAAGDWDHARIAAAQVLELGGDADPAVTAEAREVAVSATRNAEDEAFLAQLDEIRENRGDRIKVDRGRYGNADGGLSLAVARTTASSDAETDAAYEAAFAAFAEQVGSTEASIERLRASPLRHEFAAGACFWCWIRKIKLGANREAWKPIDDLAREIDPANAGVMEALLSADPEDLLAITEKRGNELPLVLAAQVGLTLLETGRVEASIAFLTEQHRRAPGDFWINRMLGHAAGVGQDPERAVRHQLAALAVQPTKSKNWSDLGSALKARGDLEEAIAAFKRAIEIDPNQPAPCISLGAFLCDNLGRYDEAVALFERALQFDSESAVAQMNLGIALRHRGDLGQAIAALERAIEIHPEYAYAHLQLGWALHERGDLEGAIAAFRRSIELDPESASAHGSLGRSLVESGDLDGAIAAFKRAIELDPASAPAHKSLGLWIGEGGVALHRRGDLEGAIAAFRRAVEIDPENAHVHRNLGVSLGESGDLEGAIAAFKRVTEIDPEPVGALLLLGGALLERGDLDGAIAAFKQAIEIDPEYPGAQANFGGALVQSGDLEGGITALERAIEIDPESLEAHYNLGRALDRSGDFKRAITALEKAVEIDPKDADAPFSLALALGRSGEHEAALAALERTIEIDPEHVPAHLNLGNVLHHRDDLEGAIAAYEKVLELDPTRTRIRTLLPRLRSALTLRRRLPEALLKGQSFYAARDAVQADETAEALTLLQADLTACETVVDAEPAFVIQALTTWKRSPGLAPVRSRKARRQLPEDEQEAWTTLWADVDALLERAQEAAK